MPSNKSSVPFEDQDAAANDLLSATQTDGARLPELVSRLQDLQSQNIEQTSEIAHLNRQINLLSEFKGFSAVDGGGGVRLNRQLWEAKNHTDNIIQRALNREDKMDSTNDFIGVVEAESSGDGGNLSSSANKNPNSISVMTSADTTDNNDPLSLSGSGGGTGIHANNQYDDYDEEELKELVKVASPKVSELLSEQALALNELLGSSGWSSTSDSDDYSGRKRDRRKGHHTDDDEDSVNEEWNQLEAAQLNLKDELDAATTGFAQMMYGNAPPSGEGPLATADENGEVGEAAESTYEYSEEWRDSIHQYYRDNNQSADVANTWTVLPSEPKHSYSLADHAVTLDIVRPISDRGLYIKPFLSRNELETLGIATMPSWITKPCGEVSSRGREQYMKRILDCTVEYIEPPKSKILRKLFSGWNPGPGERKPCDESGERVVDGGGEDSQRVMAYSPAKSSEDADSSADEDNDNTEFADMDGFAYASPSTLRVMEPLPVRTVTIRIRPDVLCGAVMDAMTTSVERVGGEITKRQGGHLRAVIPGRKMRLWMPGEMEREERNGETKLDNNDENTDLQGGGGEDKDDEEKATDSSSSRDAPSHVNNDDSSSVAPGLATFLSSPNIFGASSRSKPKGPNYAVLPPYLVDSQLVTKKVGRECQRLLLIRVYRIQDVARVRSLIGDANDEEFFDRIAPLDSTGEGGNGGSAIHDQRNDNDGGVNTFSTSGENNERIIDPLLESRRSLRALQEASALVQRIKAVGGSGYAIALSHPDSEGDAATVSSHATSKSVFKSVGDAITSPIRYLGSISGVSPMKTSNVSSPYLTVMERMSHELQQKHIPSPSVGKSKSALEAAKQRSRGLFPSLSKEDTPFVKSSWIFLRDCLEELDQRCLSYSTLGISPLFKFPALPTIDVHFIAQIKSFCRESMIVSLVKTASELEIYAREFEISCEKVVDAVLRPTFEMYKLSPPQLPMPVPLTAYPLDFRAPEEICQPWGTDVQAALEKISNDIVVNSTTVNDRMMPSSFELSEKAISILVSAFQKQNDEEQGARLGRKNMQVMDRLAKMQAHKRNSIAKIRGAYESNLLAAKAADEFHTLRQKCSNVGSLNDAIDAVLDVPLLICNVLVGNSAGTCYVTHSHILFNTQLVPILGGSKVHLFSILDVDVTINAPSKSVLSPLPASISFTTAGYGRSRGTREEVYNFIPSIGARRLAKFLEVLRDVALEDPNTQLKFSDKGGLIYLADD